MTIKEFNEEREQIILELMNSFNDALTALNDCIDRMLEGK